MNLLHAIELMKFCVCLGRISWDCARSREAKTTRQLLPPTSCTLWDSTPDSSGRTKGSVVTRHENLYACTFFLNFKFYFIILNNIVSLHLLQELELIEGAYLVYIHTVAHTGRYTIIKGLTKSKK